MRTRYDYIVELVKKHQPKSFIEIGVAEGNTAAAVLSLGIVEHYIGYDVFDPAHPVQDVYFDTKNGKNKQVYTKEVIAKRLEGLAPRVELIEGLTSDTLWNNPRTADMAFIDGDHRVGSIFSDYRAVEGSKVIIFDDYHTDKYDIKNYGCNEVVAGMDYKLSPKVPHMSHIRLAIIGD